VEKSEEIKLRFHSCLGEVQIASTSYDADCWKPYELVELHGSIVFFFLPRLSKLLRELGVERGNKMIIFVETKKKVDDITKAIRREG